MKLTMSLVSMLCNAHILRSHTVDPYLINHDCTGDCVRALTWERYVQK